MQFLRPSNEDLHETINTRTRAISFIIFIIIFLILLNAYEKETVGPYFLTYFCYILLCEELF
jgi:hypothetical protein